MGMQFKRRLFRRAIEDTQGQEKSAKGGDFLTFKRKCCIFIVEVR